MCAHTACNTVLGCSPLTWASVLATQKSIPMMPESTILFTAFEPPPPTPNT